MTEGGSVAHLAPMPSTICGEEVASPPGSHCRSLGCEGCPTGTENPSSEHRSVAGGKQQRTQQGGGWHGAIHLPSPGAEVGVAGSPPSTGSRKLRCSGISEMGVQ